MRTREGTVLPEKGSVRDHLEPSYSEGRAQRDKEEQGEG